MSPQNHGGPAESSQVFDPSVNEKLGRPWPSTPCLTVPVTVTVTSGSLSALSACQAWPILSGFADSGASDGCRRRRWLRLDRRLRPARMATLRTATTRHRDSDVGRRRRIRPEHRDGDGQRDDRRDRDQQDVRTRLGIARSLGRPPFDEPCRPGRVPTPSRRAPEPRIGELGAPRRRRRRARSERSRSCVSEPAEPTTHGSAVQRAAVRRRHATKRDRERLPNRRPRSRGREGWNRLRVRPRQTVGRADSGSRSQAVKKAISGPPGSGFPDTRATIPAMSRPTPSDRRRLPAFVALLLGAALVVTACGSNASSASPSSAATPSPATSTTPTARPVALGRAVAERRVGPRCDLRHGRAAGHRHPRSPADQAGRAPVHHTGRGQGDARQGLRHGDPGRVPRGDRAALQGARPHPGRFEPARPDDRPARRGGRGVLSRCRGQALRHHQERSARSGRALLLRARVRPRPAGPELDDLQGPARRVRPGRPPPRPPGDLRGRRQPPDDPVGGGQPRTSRSSWRSSGRATTPRARPCSSERRRSFGTR